MLRPLEHLGLLEGALPRIDYLDAYARVFSIKSGADLRLIVCELFQTPAWVMFLMRLRDRIVRPFGLKVSDEIGNHTKSNDFAMPFKVLSESPDKREILMGENDKHLDFRVLLRCEPWGDRIEAEEDSCLITLATAVTMHNVMGRLYFFIIKPFHRLIVSSLLRSRPRRLINQMPNPNPCPRDSDTTDQT